MGIVHKLKKGYLKKLKKRDNKIQHLNQKKNLVLLKIPIIKPKIKKIKETCKIFKNKSLIKYFLIYFYNHLT